jgi:hypothetical protein
MLDTYIKLSIKSLEISKSGTLKRNDSKFLLAHQQMFQMRQLNSILEQMDSNTFIHLKRECLA